MPPIDVVYPRIEAALVTVAEEIQIAEAEIEAFSAFRSRLRRLEPVRTSSPASGGSLVAITSVSGLVPDDVTSAYRETVLAMDHYERDYGESLVDNIEAEFGRDVRELVDGKVPIPEIQMGVVDAATEQAVDERRRFRRALEAERDSLETVNQRLGEIECRLHEWRSEGRSDEDERNGGGVEAVGFGSVRSQRLRALAEECQALSTERQQAIHGGPAAALGGIGEMSLVAYLYGEDDHRFPALVEVADVAERIEATMEA